MATLSGVRRACTLLAVVGAALAAVGQASAGDWLPHPADATWTYQWTDTAYNETPTTEKVTVDSTKGARFKLAWTTIDQGNADDAPVSLGTVSFTDTNTGIVNTDWRSNAPPADFPVLCASASQCGNSLASTYYNIIWGSKTTTLGEPLLKGATWTSIGGSADITSSSRYLGTELVTVPAFDHAVEAAKVRSDITQSGGALGDPYGSGVRTVWWVYGVGPVKVVFDHAGGSKSPVTTSVLTTTSLTPKPLPSDTNWFPFTKGKTFTYQWTNRHFKQPVVETVTTTGVANGSVQFGVTSVSGPIKLTAAGYGYTMRLDGVSNIWSTTRSQTLATLPKLGPAAQPPEKRRHFVTPFDLLDFGFNPVISAYPAVGDSWTAETAGRDWDIYGVTGTTKIFGLQTVKVPAGTFQ
ncbi:MAG: hypothetical protein QOE36_2085, partial [Gaiellaceae bacterium]|nr:hypothetical protein [Gaiellaceae bacterium]